MSVLHSKHMLTPFLLTFQRSRVLGRNEKFHLEIYTTNQMLSTFKKKTVGTRTYMIILTPTPAVVGNSTPKLMAGNHFDSHLLQNICGESAASPRPPFPYRRFGARCD